MQEIPLSIRDAFKAGLRRSERQPRAHDGGLVVCTGLKPGEDGLERIPTINQPIEGYTVSWPFPQLFRGRGVTLLCTQTAVFQVDERNWSIDGLDTWDAHSPDDPKAITAGGPWHFIDLSGTWMLFNGACVVWHTNAGPMMGNPDRVYVSDRITVQTGTSHKGRGFIGGFDAGDFWQHAWEDWVSDTANQVPVGVNRDLEMRAGFVLWSSVGGGNLLWPWLKDLAMTGYITDAGYTAAKPLFLEQLKRNDFGWAPVPWQGTVLAMKPLGDAVIVYGDNGVCALIPVTDPAPTVGMRRILEETGIVSRCAVACGKDRHVFIDTAGWLWQITPDLQATRLGYQEFFNPMLGNDIMGSADPNEGDLYLADASMGYVLTKTGLSRLRTRPISIVFTQGGLIGVTENTDAETRLEVTTAPFDMGLRGYKLVTGVEIGGEGLSNIDVAVEYKNGGSTWNSAPWQRANDSGWVSPFVAGHELRVKLRATPEADPHLEYISVKGQLIDNRDVRGLQAPAGG